MLFKFASYLLGTNNDTEETQPEQQVQQLSEESNENNTQQTQLDENSSTLLLKNERKVDANLSEEKSILNREQEDDLIEDDYMYDEQLINCSKLKNSNLDLNREDQLCDQLEDEDCEEEDQWIYITPIKRKNEEKEEICEEFASEQEEDENCNLDDGVLDDKEISNENVPKQLDEQQQTQLDDDQEIAQEKFNFYDYFNNKNGRTPVDKENCSPAKSSKTSPVKSTGKKLINHKLQLNRMEESWVIHPPPIFTLDNTFTIEENPLENLYIENPALSVMASCKSINDKENNVSTSSSTNSSLPLNKTSANRVLADRNLNGNNQQKDKTPVASRKPSMRKRANSTRKTNKKQNSNNKKSKSKKIDLTIAIQQQTTNATLLTQTVVETAEDGENKSQVLNERKEKRLLAHYLSMSPTQQPNTVAPTTSNTIASNDSTHHLTNHQSHHHTHHHYITSNNCVATFNASTSAEHKGSKSLRRNNKVALKRENLSNKPFTLHRKCLM